jgi:3-dehydroquinate dehydratase II
MYLSESHQSTDIVVKQPSILVLNGPNINLLGEREPDIYGRTTLGEVEARVKTLGQELGVTVECLQSNYEGMLIDAIHAARTTTNGLIVNMGGYTHTSVALRDALAAYPFPIVEVHISHPRQRESFRHVSLVSGVVWGSMEGFGVLGYELALRALATRIL